MIIISKKQSVIDNSQFGVLIDYRNISLRHAVGTNLGMGEYNIDKKYDFNLTL